MCTSMIKQPIKDIKYRIGIVKKGVKKKHSVDHSSFLQSLRTERGTLLTSCRKMQGCGNDETHGIWNDRK